MSVWTALSNSFLQKQRCSWAMGSAGGRSRWGKSLNNNLTLIWNKQVCFIFKPRNTKRRKEKVQWKTMSKLQYGSTPLLTYLGLFEKCTHRRCSLTSQTNHSSGRTAGLEGWRASAGSLGSAWCPTGWLYSLNNSTGNPERERERHAGKDAHDGKKMYSKEDWNKVVISSVCCCLLWRF